MKILILGPYPININIVKGGIESSVYGSVKELTQNESIKLMIITAPSAIIQKDYLEKDGRISILRLSNKLKYQIFAVFRIKKILKEIHSYSPDVCHIHANDLLNLILILLLKLKRIPFLLTIHGIISIEHKNIFKKKHNVTSLIKFIIYAVVEYAIIAATKYLIVDTKYVKDKLPIKKKHLFVIPQGINNIYFQIEDNYDVINIVSIGVISQRKGYEFSILATKELIKKNPDIQYIIIGSLMEKDRNYYDKLLLIIKENNLENNITIIVNCDQREMLKYLEKCNIFILHSEEESQGIALIEAMAAGKPIVATNRGGIPYVVQDKVNGYLCDYGDINTFSKKIYEIISDVELRNKFSRKSKELSKVYDWGYICKNIFEVYKEIYNKL